MRLAPVLALGLLLTGCEPDPWQAFPLSAEPDRQCRTGHEQGYDVYVWRCLKGQRIAVFQRCNALFGCTPTERQSARCGSTTPIERELKLTDPCEPVPAAQRWVARKPGD